MLPSTVPYRQPLPGRGPGTGYMEPMTETETPAPSGADDDSTDTQQLLDALEAAADDAEADAEADFLDGKQFEDIDAFYDAMGNDRVTLTLDVRAAEASRALDALDAAPAGDRHPADALPLLRFMTELLRSLDSEVSE